MEPASFSDNTQMFLMGWMGDTARRRGEAGLEGLWTAQTKRAEACPGCCALLSHQHFPPPDLEEHSDRGSWMHCTSLSEWNSEEWSLSSEQLLLISLTGSILGSTAVGMSVRPCPPGTSLPQLPAWLWDAEPPLSPPLAPPCSLAGSLRMTGLLFWVILQPCSTAGPAVSIPNAPVSSLHTTWKQLKGNPAPWREPALGWCVSQTLN